MRLRNRASLVTQMPEKSAPANTLSRLTQRAYQMTVALIALYLLYLFALQLLYYRSTGQIEVARTVISSPNSGTITELPVNETEHVQAGALLAVIAPSGHCSEGLNSLNSRRMKLNESIQLAQLEQREFDAKIELLRRSQEEQRVWHALELGKSGLGTSTSLSDELNQLLLKRKLVAERVSMFQKLVAALPGNEQDSCSPYTINAPQSGVVYAVHRRQFEFARQGQPLLTLVADDAAVAVELQVDEDDMAYFTFGDEVRVELPDGTVNPGKVDRRRSNAYNATERETRNYQPASTLTRIDIVPTSASTRQLWKQFDRTDVKVIAER